MSKLSLKRAEQSLKFDKAKYEKAINIQIAAVAHDVVDAFATEAMSGSFQHGAYLLDRLLGKAKQAVDIESQGQPILILPATLVTKFALDKPIEQEALPEYHEEKE